MKTTSFNNVSIWRNLSYADFLLLLYEIAFLRQYFWIVRSQQIAWTATGVVALLLWVAFVSFKHKRPIKTPWQFWIIVGLPLFLIYAMRAALPDTSFDVLNYRLVNAERSMRSWPTLQFDFLPAFYPLNPAPDMIMALGRWLAGYRLGTLVNFSVLVWTGTIVNRLLHSQIKSAVIRSFCVLVVLWTEHSLFLINSYLVDLLAIPLLLRTTEMVLNEEMTDYYHTCAFGLLIGASIALKLFNLAYVIPIALIYIWKLAAANSHFGLMTTAKKLFLMAATAILPLLPFTSYIYRETGSPVFPFYNTLFRSPLWPNSNLADGRWGPTTLFEAINWPFTIPFRHARIGELAYYSGRITIVIAAAIGAAVFFRRDGKLLQLALIVTVSTGLWVAILTGYPRYAIFPEVAGGVLLIVVVAKLFERREAKRPFARILAFAFCSAIAAQVALATLFISKYEWSMRPTIFADLRRHADEARFILRDRSFKSFLKDDSQRLTAAEFWVEGGLLTSGFEVLANPRAPILCAYVPDYFSGRAGREKFTRALDASQDRELDSLCMESEMQSCSKALANRGLEIVSALPVNIPVYSERTSLKMVLLRLRRTERNN